MNIPAFRPAILFLLPILAICLFKCHPKNLNESNLWTNDPHSFSHPEQCSVNHLDLELEVDFEQKKLIGTATYTLDSQCQNELVLDNMGLRILQIEKMVNGQFEKTECNLGHMDSILGQAIKIHLGGHCEKVRIRYETGPEATALQWVPADQTANKKLPFLFTQSQSIYARSWIPCPDGPGMRFTYQARVKVPEGMMAVMSANSPQSKHEKGIYQFTMDIPIPAYLMALGVGDFDFAPIGQRTGVYAPDLWLKKAQNEFADLEKMLETAEQLFGAYPWGRYDVLVLPASFPFGGMENPKMTFLTPTVIVGDRSLTALLAHELAHSWSGNLVTNASWNDFWLNEGFTTYLESRIMEALYGKEYADMLSLLGLQDLKSSIDDMGEKNPLTCLKLNMKDMDPEESMTDIAYEKGKGLLRFLEDRKGRPVLDEFLRLYFDHFKFKSNTTEGFQKFLSEHLINQDDKIMDTIKQWIYEPGFPPYTSPYSRQKFQEVEKMLQEFLSHGAIDQEKTSKWSTHELLHFIRSLPDHKDSSLCIALDQIFHFTESKNAEIRCAWYIYSIENQYINYIKPVLESFLEEVGRRKYILPLYEALVEQGIGKYARELFASNKHRYHPISRASIEKAIYEK